MERNKQWASIFTFLIIIFLALMIFHKGFFTWAFERHENVLSWYIRPLFLIPYCYFAFKRSLSGILLTILLLLTSMFWFPSPDSPNDQVMEFLAFEKQYLTENWNLQKALISMLVPGTMFLLAFAFWKKNIWIGIGVLILIAVLKIAWSVMYAGESGMSIIVPAILGLAVCVAMVYFGMRKSSSRK